MASETPTEEGRRAKPPTAMPVCLSYVVVSYIVFLLVCVCPVECIRYIDASAV